VLLLWSDYDLQLYETTYKVVRLDANAKPTSDPFAIALPEFSLRKVSVAHDGAGWALFFLADRYEGEASFNALGHLSFDGQDKPLGDPAYLVTDDSEGCPYDFVGGFDGGGRAWAVVSDGECQSPTRGWYAGADGIVTFSPALESEPRTYDFAAGQVGDGFVFAFVAGGESLPQGLYLRRFAAELTPKYLPPSE
jgi:hypothetical protein